MAVYVVTGGLGAGKSLISVSRIRDHLQKGLPVATNMDLRLEHLVAGKRPFYDVRRLPDYPTLEDFRALGDGSKGKFDEKTFGLIVLDEVATFLNAREWNRDTSGREETSEEKRSEIERVSRGGKPETENAKATRKRMAIVKWLRHCRKHRWHLVLITQGTGSLDSQVRTELVEHEVRCRRMDRMSVPVVSWLTKVLGFGALKLPQVHAGVVYYMELGRPAKTDTWFVPDAKSLYPAYDTAQKLTGECLGYSLLDHRSAPYLWKPRGWREALWEAVGHRWFPPSAARARYDDFRLAEKGLVPSWKQHVSYAEWLQARAGRPGPLGAEGGEAAEPVLAEPLQEAA